MARQEGPVVVHHLHRVARQEGPVVVHHLHRVARQDGPVVVHHLHRVARQEGGTPFTRSRVQLVLEDTLPSHFGRVPHIILIE